MKVRSITILIIVLYLLMPFVSVKAESYSETLPNSWESVSADNPDVEEIPSQKTLREIHYGERDGLLRALSVSDPNDPNNGGWHQGAEYAPISGSPFLLLVSVILYSFYKGFKLKQGEKLLKKIRMYLFSK